MSDSVYTNEHIFRKPTLESLLLKIMPSVINIEIYTV